MKRKNMFRIMTITTVLCLLFTFNLFLTPYIVTATGEVYPVTIDTSNRPFKWPVPNSNKISSCFEEPRNGTIHGAIDIPAKAGERINAAADGIVIRAEYSTSAGNYVAIKHSIGNDTYISVYMHMTEYMVSQWDNVKQGAQIGTVGSTGNSTGNHLDFSIRKDSYGGTRLDPGICTQLPSKLVYGGTSPECCLPYLKKISSSLGPWDSINGSFVNEGNDFYAAIVKCDTWSCIGTNNGNVEVVESTGKANCIWHFVRSNDGSYVIYNCEDNRALDCYEDYEGASVGVWDFYDSVTQHWWIKGKQNGEYRFVRNGTELVLDVTGGSADIGTNVELYHYHGGGAQLFSIYKVDKAEAGNLYIASGDSNTETKFSWDKGANCNLYNLRIRKGSPGNTTPYLDKWNLTDTSYSEVLPAGYYEAYVDFCNSFSAAGGQVIQFYVSDPVAGISTISVAASNSKTPTRFYWTETENTTVYNLRILSEQDGEMKSYQDVWNLTDTSYELVLPVGKYEVYVNACNDYNYSTSNRVQFSIREPIAGVSTISVAASNSSEPTKFTWTEAENITVYNLRISSEQDGEMKSYQDVWNLTDTSYEVVLPVGKYEVYVDACNDDNYSTSNRVQFSVCAPIAGISKIFVAQGDKLNPTKFTWTEAENITVYNLRISSEQDGEMKSYQDVWNLTDTSYEVVLPVGKYEVYVDACNDYNYSTSDKIQFLIEESIVPDCPDVETIKDKKVNKTAGLLWYNCKYADSYSVDIYKWNGEDAELIKSIHDITDNHVDFNLEDGLYYAIVTAFNNITKNASSSQIEFEIITDIFSEQIRGDVNLDNAVSVSDAVLLCRIIAEDSCNEITLTEQSFIAADCDLDGIITILDAMRLLAYLNQTIIEH